MSGEEERLTGAVDLNSSSGALPRAISAGVGRRGRKWARTEVQCGSFGAHHTRLPGSHEAPSVMATWRWLYGTVARASFGACRRCQTTLSSGRVSPSARLVPDRPSWTRSWCRRLLAGGGARVSPAVSSMQLCADRQSGGGLAMWRQLPGREQKFVLPGLECTGHRRCRRRI